MEPIECKGYRIHLEQDEDAPNPCEDFDMLGTMVCWHRRYTLGHVQPKCGHYEYAESIRCNGLVMLPLFLYDHSGITMRTTPFDCPWDSGQVGFIYTTPEKIRECLQVKRLTKKVLAKVDEILVNEVKVYDQYLTGDVWYYWVEDAEGERIDELGCGGFYGSDYALEEARAAVDYYDAHEPKQLEFKQI